jgi:predicted component of type VI protein secretion system
MPYLVITHQDELIDRREFSGPLTVGRAHECEIAIRDILLSRKHLTIRPIGAGWEVCDLGSKNGTALNGEQIEGAKRLQDGDSIRAGKSRLVFFASILSMDDASEPMPIRQRPADPREALANTVASYTISADGDEPIPLDTGGFPSPRPAPRYPAIYERAEIHSLLTTIASSSWDSIYAASRQVTTPVHTPAALDDSPRRGLRRPRSPVDLSLQVCVAMDQATAAPSSHPEKPRKRHRRLTFMAIAVWGAVLVLGAAIFTFSRDPDSRRAAADMIGRPSTPSATTGNPIEANPSVLFPQLSAPTRLPGSRPEISETQARQLIREWIDARLSQCRSLVVRLQAAP